MFLLVHKFDPLEINLWIYEKYILNLIKKNKQNIYKKREEFIIWLKH